MAYECPFSQRSRKRNSYQLMARRAAGDGEPSLRPSGYVSRFQELGYDLTHPFYDLLIWWCFLPLGGERACRRQFAGWFELEPGQRVLSLCCGSGSSEQAMLEVEPNIEITGLDLGRGQIAKARHKDRGRRIDYRVADASRTELPTGSFDRVLISFALHEMPRALRRDVLCEARRLCKAGGRVIALEHGIPGSRGSRLARAIWWFYWLPGNPELATTRDLQRHGLANEMREAGLEVLRRHCSRSEWIEGVVARPCETATA